MLWTLRWPMALMLLVGSVGCDDGGSEVGAPDEPEPEPTGVTWTGEIRALVAENCTTCHYTGSAAPFVFETPEQVADAAGAMLDSMVSGRMPPWPADPACRPLEGERLISPADVTHFEAWIAAGMPAGAAAEPITFEPPTFDADLTLRPANPYTPQLSTQGDDYRCLILDARFDAPTWITGATVEPGSAAVHHVITFALTPEQGEIARMLDAQTEGEGYHCFGGPLPEADGMPAGLAPNVADWVPGRLPRRSPPDTGTPIPAGTQLVMQVHYSASGGAAAPDRTTVMLQTTQTPPAFVERELSFAITDLDIPAGMSDVEAIATFRNWSDAPTAFVEIGGHMHLLGKSIEGRVMSEGVESACALSIPDWDFDWQLRYRVPEDAPLVVQPGDALQVECTHDNSQANQPVVDGQQIEPRDVQWGEGSLDEMCILAGRVIEPYVPPTPDAKPCTAAAECYADSDGSMSGLLACEAGAACMLCPIRNGAECGLNRCAVPLAQAGECLYTCALSIAAFGGPIGRCFEGTCPDVYERIVDCADPLMKSGDCDAALTDACGLSSGAR